ncbi:hypothetical protein ANASTE_00653 [Anaerofustis stercorihominis DSM 17244]|uniref:Uncharacterized protein n=1 Tax=Anaerofustis stercorihominis DSM 17244 TaxID=445971 RepID=B1C7F1_9FIRM|nr:hypothetical protein ANASTE_00653 [Anaerofustis stercorihominis DSM 17244]
MCQGTSGLKIQPIFQMGKQSNASTQAVVAINASRFPKKRCPAFLGREAIPTLYIKSFF